MKNLLALVAAVALTVPFTVACQHTISSSDQTTRHLDGSVSHDETTVKQNDLTGSVTTEHEKNNNP